MPAVCCRHLLAASGEHCIVIERGGREEVD